jgi:molybdopterin converting factor small subunit
MATSPLGNLPANPTIPLTPEVRAAYQDLYNKMQAELDGTMDGAVIEALNAWQPQVDQILRKDDEYRLSADTNIFEALQKQISDTNKGLKTLRDQISSIASHFAMAGDIIAAINKVFTLIPGA